MAKYRTYRYELINPDKCLNWGDHILVRSSWEKDFAHHCDILPNVVQWGYEILGTYTKKGIPYRDPLTNRQKIYIPDFYARIASPGGHEADKVFEIKPMHEQLNERARNRNDAALIARNAAKWRAAIEWCERHNAEFVVLNESNLYLGHENRPLRKNPIKGFGHIDKTARKSPIPSKSKRKKTYALISRLRKKKAAEKKNRLIARTASVAKAKSVGKTRSVKR